MREQICFDEDWLFHRGDIDVPSPTLKSATYISSKTERMLSGPAARYYRDSLDVYGGDQLLDNTPWEHVTLPHDYIIEGTPDPAKNQTLGFFKYDNAWYRKRFVVEESDRDKRLSLYFDGVATHATVYVNGCQMAHNFCGYTSFEVDITDVVRYGEDNTVAVYVQSDSHEGWWYQGGGLYRHVWLKKTALLSVDTYGVWVNPKALDDGQWCVPVETTIRNDSFEPAEINITHEVIDPNGSCICTADTAVSVNRKHLGKAQAEMQVANPLLWHMNHPHLYTLRTTLRSPQGDPLDEYSVSFGFRTLEFNGEGFWLNGEKTVIKGVCCHQDYGLTGKAVPDNIHRYRMRLMKDMGANALRTAHYPHAEETMEACDRLGLMVMNETRWFESTPEGLAQLEMLMKRDRNRPSVIMWSVGNEEPFHETDEGRRIVQTMYAYAKRLDDSRPVMTAISNNPAMATVNDISDIIGVNYNLPAYDTLHEKYPTKTIISSECCATGTTRGWYLPEDEYRGRLDCYDRDVNQSFMGRERTWKYFMARPWLAGAFQWAGIEHRGEAAWPRLCSVSGAYDLYLIRKDAFWQNRSHWTDQPMVHILPHWNLSGREGEMIRACVYHNCEEVELLQDGKSLGRKKNEPYGHVEFQVAYHPGEVKAVGYRDGQPVCEDLKVTSGQARELRLELMNGDDLSPNGCDLAVVHCTCVDEAGQLVPDASPFISFTTNGLGSVAGTGSDHTDHIPPQCPDRRMWAGVCACAIRVGSKPGQLRVYAHAEGLKPATLEIDL
ncbi:glycoside hydrolase family 2 TIM barrel-domain containing protein [Ruficoccus sp. ZRK36]|uniref:glycoside hydrolase family 2 TIM barrel-domain containing protein n=1 Tax=Ruficoccus sp. ZRK36 TaxID=2866311 RepID=UPI001C73B2E4|nr:glycoside hydrolase family 2 TIM barrel-domain containing protein [Ruficoccus sp. ZRK36]QYY34329.1 DUF4982 domain-containing protein [Ruficoccus sp. ZRK36]